MTLKLVIFGGGAVVREFYLPALSQLGLSSEALIVDTNSENLKEIRQHDKTVKTLESSAENFFKNDSLVKSYEAAVIALPNRFHVEITRLALRAGLHVLCEKPLALDEKSCLELEAESQKAHRILEVGMVRRYLPSVLAANQALQAGRLGRLLSIDVEDGAPYNWMVSTGAFFARENGGVLADRGVHYLDLIESFAGRLKPVAYRDDCQGGTDTNASYQLISESGVTAQMGLSWTRRLRNTLILKGSLGEIILEKDNFAHCFWKPTSGETQILSASKPFLSGDWSPTLDSCFIQQLFQFSSAIQKNNKPKVSAAQAATSARLIEWAYDQRAQGSVAASQPSSTSISLNPSKVFVSGGTGFIGSHLIERLNAMEGIQITAPIRQYRSACTIARYRVAMPKMDLMNFRQVKESIQGARYVFHLAYGRDGKNPKEITVQGTKNVVEAAIQEGAEAVVILSTAYVFGRPSKAVDEKDAYSPIGGEYGNSKAEMERWCLDRAKSSGKTRLVILSPTCVYGPGGKTYTQMPFVMAQNGSFCWIENGKGLANYIFIDNLINAVLLASTCLEAHGQRFLLNDGVCTWKEFLTPLLKKYEQKIPSYTRQELRELKNQKSWKALSALPGALGNKSKALSLIRQISYLDSPRKFFSANMPTFYRLLKKSSGLSSKAVSAGDVGAGVKEATLPPEWLADLFGNYSTTFSSAKAKTMLGWSPQVDLATGQKKCLEWLEETV